MSGPTRIVDGDGKLAGIRGNPLEVDSSDMQELLWHVLLELRVMNEHLSELTGAHFDMEE